jgi:hypothetical protein
LSNDHKNENTSSGEGTDTVDNPGAEKQDDGSAQSGPTFTEGPDPLAGVKKGASDVMASMEGKTVSMKTYVGSIAAVIILMLLARCG